MTSRRNTCLIHDRNLQLQLHWFHVSFQIDLFLSKNQVSLQCLLRDWGAAPGRWILLRIGHCCLHPAPPKRQQQQSALDASCSWEAASFTLHLFASGAFLNNKKTKQRRPHSSLAMEQFYTVSVCGDGALKPATKDTLLPESQMTKGAIFHPCRGAGL